jgi:chemotaxis protein CheD
MQGIQREWSAGQRAGGATVVGIAELRVSDDRDEILVTHALGSCLGIVAWDPVVRVGGVLHAMLPSSDADGARAQLEPARFVDSGVSALFRASYALGARKQRMITRVVGGAAMAMEGRPDRFHIGRRNYLSLRSVLWKAGVLLGPQDVGGSQSRTVWFHVGSGEMTIRSGAIETRLSPHVGA